MLPMDIMQQRYVSHLLFIQKYIYMNMEALAVWFMIAEFWMRYVISRLFKTSTTYQA